MYAMAPFPFTNGTLLMEYGYLSSLPDSLIAYTKPYIVGEEEDEIAIHALEKAAACDCVHIMFRRRHEISQG